MKKALIFLLVLFLSCTDDEGNPCIYQPTLTTEAVTNITETSATLNGTIDITSENCETPNNTEQGFVYSTEIQPTTDDIQVNVNGTNISTTIEGLEPNTTYYVRSFLTNAFGEFYGNEVEFTTNEGCDESGTITDQDGNSYDYICYGNQLWLVENVQMVTYRDGTPIPQVTDATEWASLNTGAWCYYNNDPTQERLYNWYAVMGIYNTASLSDVTLRKEFAPEGWHVPSNDEWATLEEYLIANGYNYDGSSYSCSPCSFLENKIGKAMASTSGWVNMNDFGSDGEIGYYQSLNNSSGFNAKPVGYRTSHSSGFIDGETLFHTSTDCNTDRAWKNYFYSWNTKPIRSCEGGSAKQGGFSVRLVKD